MEELRERTLASSTVFEGRIIKVKVDRVALPDGRESDREVVLHGGAAAVVALDDDRRVFVVEQYRYAAGETILEIPAGKLDPGESPLACAERELEEEAGVRARSWLPLGAFLTSPGFSNEVVHIFLATGLERAAGCRPPDDDESLTVRRIPLQSLKRMVASGLVRDAKTATGILLAADAMETGKRGAPV
ncbi:MAG: NUDIX hydrolase [Firmicutes bacterium]|jgi:ADP-ribose pyrophosphatase|nr:NUDIX hydrolase [Bacillota bacterium]